MSDRPLSIGGSLTKQSFDEFKTRLLEDNVNAPHGTANPIWCVYTQEPIYGVNTDWHDGAELVVLDTSDSTEYIDLNEFYESRSDEVKFYLDGTDDSPDFLDLSYSDQLDLINYLELNDVCVTHRIFVDKWVSAHLTSAAAWNFIKRKLHDYPYGLQSHVNSNHMSWEYNAIIKSILDGELVYKSDAIDAEILYKKSLKNFRTILGISVFAVLLLIVQLVIAFMR